MRWKTGEGRRLASAASGWLHGGTSRRPKALEVVDGRVDLRGFAMHHLESAAAKDRRGAVSTGKGLVVSRVGEDTLSGVDSAAKKKSRKAGPTQRSRF